MPVNRKSRNFQAWKKKKAEQKALKEDDFQTEETFEGDEEIGESEDESTEELPAKKRKVAPRRSFEVGQTCVLTDDVEQVFGTFKEGTDVELLSGYMDEGKAMWLVTTLACSECTLIIKFHVEESVLIDYNDWNPPYVV